MNPFGGRFAQLTLCKLSLQCIVFINLLNHKNLGDLQIEVKRSVSWCCYSEKSEDLRSWKPPRNPSQNDNWCIAGVLHVSILSPLQKRGFPPMNWAYWRGRRWSGWACPSPRPTAQPPSTWPPVPQGEAWGRRRRWCSALVPDKRSPAQLIFPDPQTAWSSPGRSRVMNKGLEPRWF